MQEYLNQLDPSLIFKKVQLVDNTYHIYCEKQKLIGPYVNSKKVRHIKDINYGNYKVILHITTRKYFPYEDNPHYSSDNLDFLNYSKRRTKRLDDFCTKLASNQSLIGTQRLLKDGIADISDSTIAYIISKKNS